MVVCLFVLWIDMFDTVAYFLHLAIHFSNAIIPDNVQRLNKVKAHDVWPIAASILHLEEPVSEGHT